MRTWLRTVVSALLIAPASALLGAAADADPTEAETEVAPGGLAVRGAGFYVWDEDARLASAWGAELRAMEPGRGTSLSAVLRALAPLERTWVISSWATSASEPTRLMLASALAEPLDGVGARWALEHLQRDPSAVVRERALAAASGTGLATGL